MKAESAAAAHPPLGASVLELAPWWIGICLIAALAWVVTITWAGPMGVGPGTMGQSLAAFVLIWVVMMAAMMFPSVAPMCVVWIRSVAARSTTQERVVGIASFLAGYLLAWATVGVAVYVGLVGAGRLVAGAPGAARWAGAAIFGAAGVYQLSPAKGACLRHCRSPVRSRARPR